MVSDEEFLTYYESAEEAEKQGCAGCSSKLEDFRVRFKNVYSYQLAYFFNRELRTGECEGKTVYLNWRKLGNQVIITWRASR